MLVGGFGLLEDLVHGVLGEPPALGLLLVHLGLDGADEPDQRLSRREELHDAANSERRMDYRAFTQI